MFEYKLKGKHVILSLDPEFLPHFKYCGIDGTPLFAKVLRMESEGLWLESDHFQACPRPIVKLYGPKGEPFCRAHIFIPRVAIISVVAFPSDVPDLDKDPKMHRIGFRLKEAKKKKARI